MTACFPFPANNCKNFLLIVFGDFDARNSKWWLSNRETFVARSIYFLTTSAGYTQLLDQPTHVINNSSSCLYLVPVIII